MHCYLPLNLNTRARNYSKHIADKPKEQQLKFTIAKNLTTCHFKSKIVKKINFKPSQQNKLYLANQNDKR